MHLTLNVMVSESHSASKEWHGCHPASQRLIGFSLPCNHSVPSLWERCDGRHAICSFVADVVVVVAFAVIGVLVMPNSSEDSSEVTIPIIALE